MPGVRAAPAPESTARTVNRQRWALLRRIEHALEWPMVVLGLVWLALLVLELTRGLDRTLEFLGLAIWVVFLADFSLQFLLAPAKLPFLRKNWLTALALLLPAFRVFRVFRALRLLRAARAARSLRLARLLTSVNRGMKALGTTMSRRGFGYVALLTVAVTFAGAAGMYAFERPTGSIGSYGQALWWTAMMMTTMGSETWPATSEGRVLCLLLALYAFTVFGYVTATLATFFIGRDEEHKRSRSARPDEIRALREDIAQLRDQLQRASPVVASPRE